MIYDKLFKCYCHARESQAFFTKCLDDDSYTAKEKDMIYELVTDSVKMSEKIKEYCRA
ncbi:hypothetical protein PO902_17465 (plasmid) [Planococcus maritimus]|nr:hypothetical protein [Planococcus sp. SK3692]MDE4086838.1 hypothetical protein [Planococcus maritimus]